MVKKYACLIAFFIIWISAHLSFGQEVKLPEIMKPENIRVYKDRIYITEDVYVFIYSLKTFKMEKKVGGHGEGPQEFTRIPTPMFYSLFITIQPDCIFVSNINKIAFFTLDGTFISELRTRTVFTQYIPFGDRLAGINFGPQSQQPSLLLSLFDKQLKQKKELTSIPFPIVSSQKTNILKLPSLKDSMNLFSQGNKLVFASFEEGTITIFNNQGKIERSISPTYNRVKVTDSIIQQVDSIFSNDIRLKEDYLQQKAANLLYFPEYLPAVKSYWVSNEKIYIITPRHNNSKYETLVFNVRGKLLHKTWLELKDKNILVFFPFTICNDKIYQLIEDEEAEEWRLVVTPVGKR